MDKKELGQVYTPENVANLMADLIISQQPKEVLEPCFGEGVLIESLIRRRYSGLIYGIEVDEESYNKVRENKYNMELKNTNFFNYYKKVDAIIMNPPYVSHTVFGSDSMQYEFSKAYIRKQTNADYFKISMNSNLYIYFLLKAFRLLNEGGSLCAIIPSIWMNAAYGVSFKKFLLSHFKIEKIFLLNYEVFPDAVVESCIIFLKKEKCIDSEIEWSVLNSKLIAETTKTINQSDLCESENWFTQNTKDKNENLIQLKEVATVKSGISTNNNDFFIKNINFMCENHSEYVKPIISSPKNIPFYNTSNLSKSDYIFMTTEAKSNLPKEIQEYIEQEELRILDETIKNNVTLRSKLKRSPENWFNLKDRKTNTLLFNYMIRNNKKVIFNTEDYLYRSNFLGISAKKGILDKVLFAILNSSHAKYQMELCGRFYGSGLLKLQKYEFENMYILNPLKLSAEETEELVNLADQLMSIADKNEEDSVIHRIDAVISNYIAGDFYARELEVRFNRLSKKTDEETPEEDDIND